MLTSLNTIDFSEKNLTSNSGTLMLYNHAATEGIFDINDEEVNNWTFRRLRTSE